MEHFHCCAVIRGFRAEQDVEVLVRAIPTLNAERKLQDEMKAGKRLEENFDITRAVNKVL